MGVSGFFTLNAVAIRAINSPDQTQSPDTVIIVDRSHHVEHFWTVMEPIIVSSKSRVKVIVKIEEIVQKYFEEGRYYFEPGIDVKAALQSLQAEISDGRSWLSTDAKFAKIKDIFAKGRFVFKRMELCDYASFQILSEVLQQNGITVDFIYLSNCAEYLETPQEKSAFIKSMEKIIQADTLVIQTRPRSCKSCFRSLIQYVQRRNTSDVAALFPEAPPAPFHLRGVVHPPKQQPINVEIKLSL